MAKDNYYAKDKPTVLILEDDPDANSLMAGIVRLKGYIPIKAHTADECVDKVHEYADQVDVAILNGFVTMEKGGMLISRIRKVNPNIKILVLAEQEGDRSKLMSLGADHITTKPISAETITDKITNLLASDGALTKASE